VRKLLHRVPCQLGFDLAALDAPKSRSGIKPPGPTRSIAICPCSLAEFSQGKHLDERYWAPLADALAILHRDSPIRVIFLCLFSGCSAVPDSAVARLIADRLPDGVPVEFREYDGHLDEFFGEFSRDHAFLCSKYHSAVAAYLASRKFAVIAYNKKVMDFADEIHLDADLRIQAHEPQPSDLWLRVLRRLLTQNGPCPATMPVEVAQTRARQAALRVFDMLPQRL
jgi:polysaccharide pyruvyl transferase WcaK-like protein